MSCRPPHARNIRRTACCAPPRHALQADRAAAGPAREGALAVTGERVRRVAHSVGIDAPAGVVYGLVADAVRWPLFLPTSVHVERLEFDGVQERLRVWTTASGRRTRSWVSLRLQDPQARRITFRRQHSPAPVETMSGTWTVEEQGDGTSLLTLLHDFTVTGDRGEDLDRVARALDADSAAELAGLKRLAERWHRLDDLVLSFEDAVRVKGPPELVYDFLYRVSDWPGLLPHVTRLELTEDTPGIQAVTAGTRAADGTVHTTESVRICFPHAGRIVHKHTVAPALLAAHTGEWSVLPDETGVTVVSQHSVVLREEAVERVLGPGADLTQARRHVRETLGRDSRTTLQLARRHAESAIRVL